MEQIFNQIPADTFQSLIPQVGVIMFDFDPEKDKFDRDTVQKKLAFATTGGIQIRTTTEFQDNGADIDNCPNNMAEFKDVSGNGWDCGFSTTAISASPNLIKFGLGVADTSSVSASGDAGEMTKIVPRSKLRMTDFQTITWGGHTADGGVVMAVFKRALSIDGFNLQTQKNTKGQFSLNVTAHYSLQEQDVVPVAYYYMEGDDEAMGLSVDAHMADKITAPETKVDIGKYSED